MGRGGALENPLSRGKRSKKRDLRTHFPERFGRLRGIAVGIAAVPVLSAKDSIWLFWDMSNAIGPLDPL